MLLICVIIIIDEDIVTTITWLQYLLKSCKYQTVGAKILDHFRYGKKNFNESERFNLTIQQSTSKYH